MTWFLRTTLDQLDFMAGLFDLDTLARRLERLVTCRTPEALPLLLEALRRGDSSRNAAKLALALP